MGLEVQFKKFSSLVICYLRYAISKVLTLLGQPPQTDDLTAIIIYCGESTYDQCLSALRNQTVPVKVKIIKDIHPLSASLDAALDACETKWLLMVDADTIIHPYCVELICRNLQPGIGMVVAHLLDKVYGVIGFLRMVDAESLKKHGFRHPENDPYPDRRARDFLLGLGLKRIVLSAILGIHNPYATNFEIFRRFYGTYRKRDSNEQQMKTHVVHIMKYANRKKAWSEAYYMMAGLVCGAMANPANTRDYIQDEEMQQYFQAISKKDAGKDDLV